jgi:hypothetical protein
MRRRSTLSSATCPLPNYLRSRTVAGRC